MTLPGGKKLILTQTGGKPPCHTTTSSDNFDASETNNSKTKCTKNDRKIPVFHVTVDGRPLSYRVPGRFSTRAVTTPETGAAVSTARCALGRGSVPERSVTSRRALRPLGIALGAAIWALSPLPAPGPTLKPSDLQDGEGGIRTLDGACNPILA